MSFSNSISKSLTLFTLIVGLFILAAFGRSSEHEPFKILIEVGEFSATISPLDSEAWECIYSVEKGNSLQFNFTEGGVSSRSGAFADSRLNIDFVQTNDGYRLTSNGNTYWTQLEYSCGGKGLCRFVITEHGVSGY